MIVIMREAIPALFDDAKIRTFPTKHVLFRAGDTVRVTYLVQSGQIDLVRHTENGITLILNRVGAGNVLAEASVYSPQYHCDGIATSVVEVKALRVDQFLSRLAASPNTARLWAGNLAHELQKARTLSEIRALKTIATKLDAWLAIHETLPPKGHYQDVAHMLGISREALYRELARRRI